MPAKGSKKMGVAMGWRSIIDGRLYASTDPQLRGRGNPPSDPAQPTGFNVKLNPAPVELWRLEDGSIEAEEADSLNQPEEGTSEEVI